MASNSGCESPAVVTVVDRLQRQESSGGVKIFGLSPVSEIAVNLQEATLDTPKGPTRRVTGGRALGKGEFESVLIVGSFRSIFFFEGKMSMVYPNFKNLPECLK